MNSSFNMSIWENIENVMCVLDSATDSEEVQELCGSEIKIIIMALTQIQTRLERNSKRTD